ncbi:MAG: peroxiredoxin [Sphingomonadales bacterium]|nr:peroxiredoxin [Sphingomonadales bacterium]
MRRAVVIVIALVALLAGAVLLLYPRGAEATGRLAVGDPAPRFVTTGTLGGETFRVDLASEIAKGPVVLYFYPAAFTTGCTLEANAFAEAMPRFRAAGATVLGLSADDLGTLRKFSVSECRGKFAVAPASKRMIADYGVALKKAGVDTGVTTRTSYVVGSDGRIAFVHDDMDYHDHVRLTLAAVERLAATR